MKAANAGAAAKWIESAEAKKLREEEEARMEIRRQFGELDKQLASFREAKSQQQFRDDAKRLTDEKLIERGIRNSIEATKDLAREGKLTADILEREGRRRLVLENRIIEIKRERAAEERQLRQEEERRAAEREKQFAKQIHEQEQLAAAAGMAAFEAAARDHEARVKGMQESGIVQGVRGSFTPGQLFHEAMQNRMESADSVAAEQARRDLRRVALQRGRLNQGLPLRGPAIEISQQEIEQARGDLTAGMVDQLQATGKLGDATAQTFREAAGAIGIVAERTAATADEVNAVKRQLQAFMIDARARAQRAGR